MFSFHVQANLKNSSERLIKGIVDLRKKIYMVHEKLEHEVKVRVALNYFVLI